MDFIVKCGFLFLLILILSCKSKTSQNYETSNEIEVPSQSQTDSIASVFEKQKEVLENATPEHLKKKVEEVRNEKKANSVFLGEGCCSNEPPPSLCCCEPVWIKYLEIYKSGDAKKIAKIRSEDPILNDCYKKIPSFKKKVDELEMSDEE